MEVKSTDSSFVISDNAKGISFSILGILALIAIAFFALVPDMGPMGMVALFVAIIYFFTGYISKTYTFNKEHKTFSLHEALFFKTNNKHYTLDDIQNIVFVRINDYGPVFGVVTAAAELKPVGIIVALKTGEKIRIVPSASNFIKYLFHRDLVKLNESEAKVGKELAEFLHVPFEVKKAFDISSTHGGPSRQFITFLLKIVYLLLILLVVFITVVLFVGIFNRFIV